MKQALKAALLLSLTLAAATTAPGKPVTVDELLVNAPPGDWRSPDPDNTLYLEIPGGRVVIELAPRIAPLHIANIKSLTRARYFDGLAIVRVQDNYVVQWNDRDHQKPIPRLPSRPRSAHRQRLARPLLWHGRRRPGRSP
jgi:peptidylprolyl isomerase